MTMLMAPKRSHWGWFLTHLFQFSNLYICETREYVVRPYCSSSLCISPLFLGVLLSNLHTNTEAIRQDCWLTLAQNRVSLLSLPLCLIRMDFLDLCKLPCKLLLKYHY
ncbi:hypothetical protein XELAEV_18018516mg [Xenopus laevis]|uniref:Uncharacterized protein n=1 Tax=Xenopus laevis TaxID=8355 RepID=A0A974DDN7_XENLA|nr:hypothetical protein XELAEV_18018516mg [Xenopus laevis]